MVWRTMLFHTRIGQLQDLKVLDYDKYPSDHSINVSLDRKKHVMDSGIHGQGSATMQQFVTLCILQQLIKDAAHWAKSASKGQKCKVGKGTKAIGWFQKMFQNQWITLGWY